MDKDKVKECCLQKIQIQIDNLKDILQQTLSATENDTKSSAGDKHETARSMAQLEQEKLTSQINKQLKLQEKLNSIHTNRKHSLIMPGSLVQTSIGWLFISVGIGNITCDGIDIFAISEDAPLFNSIKGKKENNFVNFNNQLIDIIHVS